MNVTAIVPSLNPDEKLMQVVEGLLRVGFSDIVLVNDGSDAAHTAPFEEAARFPEVTVLTHEVNRGKGVALKTAFAWCIANRPGIDGVVTADGDNQHKAEDILRCAEQLCAEPDKVWLGVRDFSLEHVPLRSRFGNTVTRVIMRMGGVRVTDTQTGLRAVSREYLPLMCEISGDRYEYETEMLLVLADKKITVGEVVIETVYIDENQTSHFNTLKDSWRIYKVIFRHIFHRLASFLKFSASSLITSGLDILCFTAFNLWVFAGMGSGTRELAATFSARVISAAANFAINRRMVFGGSGSVKRSALRYTMLSVVQLALSAGLVYAIATLSHASDAVESFIKIPVDVALFFLSYQVQRRWVFAPAGEQKS